MPQPDSFGTGTPNRNAFPPVEELSYEAARDELVQTVQILERGNMTLDESLAYWERGEALAKRCEDYLAGASQRIENALGTTNNSSQDDSATEEANGAPDTPAGESVGESKRED